MLGLGGLQTFFDGFSLMTLLLELVCFVVITLAGVQFEMVFVFDWGSIDIFMGWGFNQDWGFK